ncbi:MAG: hypothetical protein KG029_00805 [Bacteroidetes bacterium]|nr:hypothetical protein [Bacteroidota bacterium]
MRTQKLKTCVKWPDLRGVDTKNSVAKLILKLGGYNQLTSESEATVNEIIEQTWGMRFNSGQVYNRARSADHLPGCPEWLNSNQLRTFQEPGLVVWNNLDQKIEHLGGSAALNLLDRLLCTDAWKTEGVFITHLVQEFSVEIARRGRRKKTESEEKLEKPPSKPYYKEMLHLPPSAGNELIKLIQADEAAITKMAEFERLQFDLVMKGFWESVLKSHRRIEQDEIDFSARNFNWQHTSEARWNCQYQSTTGKVCLPEEKWQWCACAERPGLPRRLKYWEKFQEAIEWVEKEIVDLANQPETEVQPSSPSFEQILAEHIRLQEKLRNGPCWVNPSLLETKKPTYKIFIELDAEPTTYKTFTSFCSGQTFRIDERFLTPTKLSAVLNLPYDHFGFEQILGENSGWHRITSLTAFYQETTVAEQAQDVWNRSRILQQFKAGQIKRARYGYQEVETGYTVFLGICEKPEDAWGAPESRDEYFAQKALRESLCFALDIEDYRAFLGLSVKDISDDRLLECMHTARARSTHLPEQAIRESKIWLALHEPIRGENHATK